VGNVQQEQEDPALWIRVLADKFTPDRHIHDRYRHRHLARYERLGVCAAELLLLVHGFEGISEYNGGAINAPDLHDLCQ
jgi:hypothetical protein